MAFDLDDEELEATRKLFSTPTDEKVLKNIIAEYDARVEDGKTYSVTVPVSRKETIAMSNLLKKVKEQKEELNKYIVMLTDEQYRRLVNIIRDDVNKEWQDKIKAKIENYNSKGYIEASGALQELLEEQEDK